jgi:hypothetical protein
LPRDAWYPLRRVIAEFGTPWFLYGEFLPHQLAPVNWSPIDSTT